MIVAPSAGELALHAVNIEPVHRFVLSDEFVAPFASMAPPWGPLGEFTYRRTYARELSPGVHEEWHQTVRRVVEGCFTYQKWHCETHGLPWSYHKAHRSAKEMYRLIFEMKFLPPGRGLWMCGTPYVEKVGSAALNNCAFVSTRNIDRDFADPFTFLMDFSMLGVGVGGDTRGAGKLVIRQPEMAAEPHVVPDTREGWVDIVRRVLNSYAGKGTQPSSIDVSQVRKKGQTIKGFGGVSAGPEPLLDLVFGIKATLDPLVGQPITSSAIVDLFNKIGVCVVAGNVRRSAEIMLGDPNDQAFTELKDYTKFPTELTAFRWASNNSILATIGMDYTEHAKRTALNGEPGYFWLQTAQAYGRMIDPPNWADEDAEGTNPCSEQTLCDHELCCCTGETRILTRDGYPMLKDVVGSAVDVWNGEEWSTVVPFKAKRSTLVRVHLSDGSYLDCTPDHGWHVRPSTASVFRRVNAEELKPGDVVASFEIPDCEGISVPDAYSYGFFLGDGHIDNGQARAWLYGSKMELAQYLASSSVSEHRLKPGYNVELTLATLTIDPSKAVELKAIDGLPDWVFRLDRSSALEFVSGWIDADGSVRRQPNTDGLVVHGSEGRMRDLQLLLRRCGVNGSTVRLEAGARATAPWKCYIPSYEAVTIPTRLKKATRPGSRTRVNNRHPEGLPISRVRTQRVTAVEPLGDEQVDTFCFTEPKRHMGVFGNALTYQCLVETFPSRHDSYIEYERTLKFAYLYAKSITLVPTHNRQVNSRVMRNRRIGCSQSGIIDSFTKHGKREHLRWCDEGYAYLRSMDKVYSDWLCVPVSRKITSVKPSGTVSLLPGVSPGIHYPHSKYYYRTIRVDARSPLVAALRAANYRVEPAVTDPNTVVCYFPVKEENFDRSKDDVSMWEQLENAAVMQHYWADNQVSITVTFKLQEALDLEPALELYEHRLKSVSFLPLSDHGYEQAPYQTLTEAEYQAAIKDLKSVDYSVVSHESTDAYCDGDSCILPRTV